MEVLLDTNFLMVPTQFGVDIFEFLKDYELETLSSCIDELKKLSRKKSRNGTAARVALKLIKDNKIKIVKAKEKGDKAILIYAVKNKCSVGTNDKNLIKALKKNGIKVIRLRQKQYLVEE